MPLSGAASGRPVDDQLGITSRASPVSSGYKTDDTLIDKTLTSNNLQDLYHWQDYLATRLPLMWQPTPVALTEIADNLKGATPQSPTDAINPENWYFVK